MKKKVTLIVLTLIFVFLGVLFWRMTLLLSNLSTLFSEKETVTEAITSNKIRPKQTPVDNNRSKTLPEKERPVENIEETIARLKQDVLVTGTITGIPGRESAMFQIEGMKDRLFNINTQLMDGFIIVEISGSYVVLKNQLGNESLKLQVQKERKSFNAPEMVNNIPQNVVRNDPQILKDSYSGTIPLSSNFSEATREIDHQENNERFDRYEQSDILLFNTPAPTDINNELTSSGSRFEP